MDAAALDTNETMTRGMALRAVVHCAGATTLAAFGSLLALPLVAQQAPGATAVISGIVYDSIVRHTIAGATVQLVNADDPSARPLMTRSDSSGRYSMTGVPYGSYLAAFLHSALDTLGLENPLRRVQVERATQRLDLATPSARTVMAAVCPVGTRRDSTALLIGHVRGTDDQMPKPGAKVAVEWSELVVNELGIGERRQQVTGQAEEPGWFAICGLPTEGMIQARAYHGADTSGYIEAQLEPGGLRHLTFFIGGASAMPMSPEDRADGREASLRGGARLTGTVVDRNGRPIIGAHAMLWQTRVQGVTNDRGAFALDGLPGGTHTLEVRAIGHVPVTMIVHLAESRPATADVIVAKTAEILQTVTVRAELVYSRGMAEFDRRRRSGFGKYVTIEEISRRPNTRLSFLLQGMPGIQVVIAGARSQVTMQRNATTVSIGSGPRVSCVPSLYVDGTLDIANDFDAYYSDQLVGIEIYRESSRPFEFIDSRNACGAVAVWTRPLAPKKPR